MMQQPVKTVSVDDQEAAHARFVAISQAYSRLTEQAKALIEAVANEWVAADEQLRTVQRSPGIDYPAEGQPYTYEQRDELERHAAARLAEIFPWAKL